MRMSGQSKILAHSMELTWQTKPTMKSWNLNKTVNMFCKLSDIRGSSTKLQLDIWFIFREEGYTVGIGVNPLMWKTRLEWVSDPGEWIIYLTHLQNVLSSYFFQISEYFVYEFKRIPRISVQGHEMTDLCSMFQNSVQVTDDAEMMQSDGIFWKE